jgi:hypothetical protein
MIFFPSNKADHREKGKNAAKGATHLKIQKKVV